MQVISGAGRFTRPAGPDGTHWIEHLSVADLSAGHVLDPGRRHRRPGAAHRGRDLRGTAGRAVLQAGGDSVPVGPGSVVYVAAGEGHRFTDITEDLAAFVLFAPAEGSRSPAASP